MSRHPKVPDALHPITVTPTPGRVRILAGDQVIADTTAALTLRESTYPPVQYVPLADVDPAVLSATSTSTYCPFKGDASYYSVTTPSGTIADAGWTYPEAYEAVADIRGHVAWYPDRVTVEVLDA
ncbi:DUF427 domain-containing protein [Mumia sp. DW29H23]|uniref:DUF427 domain-containing protein n=1 Tax=Mumia sp. DW29H23 TaxID=3421241 RepID=UPI003D69CA50